MQMRIALTGGIGSGKSVVLDILKNRGYNVVSCDEVNKGLLVDTEYINKIREVFPEAVTDNTIDKKILSSIVFNDKEKLDRLNAIAHPIIREIILDKSANDDINFVEVPLLFESGMDADFDEVLLVTANVDTRISRAVSRDNKSKEQIQSILNNQISTYDGKKIDYIICNDSDMDSLKKEVDKYICYLNNK